MMYLLVTESEIWGLFTTEQDAKNALMSTAVGQKMSVYKRV